VPWGVPKVGAVATVASGNITPAIPGTAGVGDLLVACIAARGNAAFTLPANWNLVATQQSSGDTDATNGIASGLMAWIILGETSPSTTFTRTGGDLALARIIAYSGAADSPYDTGSANTLAVASATATTPGITTAEDDTLLVAMTSAGDNLTASAFDAATDPTTASGATDTTTAPTDGTWIERADSGSGTGADGALAIADAVKATAGATGDFQATISVSARHVMIVGAFKAHATRIWSAQAGNTSDTATWVGGVVPANGNPVTINHALTADANLTIGDSPAENGTTRALLFGRPVASLLLNDDIVLTVRGDLQMNGNTTKRDQITMSPGSVIEIDASQATDPTNQHYRWITGTANFAAAKIKVNGTKAKPCTIRSNASGGNFYYTTLGFVGVSAFEGDFLLQQRVGTASQFAYLFYLGNVTTVEMRLRDCVFDSCGQWRTEQTPIAGAQVEFLRCTWKNSLHSSWSLYLPQAPTTGGTVSDCSFDKGFRCVASGWTISGVDGNLFMTLTEVGGTTPAAALNKFLRFNTTDFFIFPAMLVEDAISWIGTGTSNPHHFAPIASGQNIVLNRCWFGYDGTGLVGDCINLQAAATRTVHAFRCVLGANANGLQQGKFLSLLGAGNIMTADRCTVVCSTHSLERGLMAFGETYAGADGEPAGVTNSLAIGVQAGSGIILNRQTNTTVVQLTNPADFHHNAIYQPVAGTDGDGYDAVDDGQIFVSGTPGASDIILNRNPCVDIFRTLKSWDASLGGPGTTQNALDELQKRYDFTVTPNPKYTLAALRAYLFEGAAVVDSRLAASGASGSTIGAGDFVDQRPAIHGQAVPRAANW
jgi:hypothetical protein